MTRQEKMIVGHANALMREMNLSGKKVNKKTYAREAIMEKGIDFDFTKNMVENKFTMNNLKPDQKDEAMLQADMLVTDMYERKIKVTRDSFIEELITGPLSFEAIAFMVNYKFE